MKKTMWKLLVGLFVIMLFCLVKAPTTEAASYVGSHSQYKKTIKAGKIKITKTNDDYDKGYCTLVVKKNGKKILNLQNVRSEFVTNGKELYYTKVTKGYSNSEYFDMDATFSGQLYKYDFKTKKHTLILQGQGIVPLAYKDGYLYYGKTRYLGDYEVYAMNVKTKKSRFMEDVVEDVMPCGKRIICTLFTQDVSNDPIYSFKPNGKGKKKIASGFGVTVKNGYVYYSKYRVKYTGGEYREQIRELRCSPTGTKTKVIKDWYSLW